MIKLEVLNLALEAIELLRPIVVRIKRHDRNLAGFEVGPSSPKTGAAPERGGLHRSGVSKNAVAWQALPDISYCLSSMWWRRRAEGEGRTGRFRRFGAATSLLSLAPPFGTELELGAERGRYHFEGGCDGTHNFVSYSAAQFRARHQWQDGGVIVGEAAGQYGKVTRSIVRDRSAGQGDLDNAKYAALLAVRAGYHGQRGGFEIGPAYIRTSGGSLAFFSANAWVGAYGAAHIWASLLGQQTLSLNRLAGVGLGHASDSLRLSLGRTVSAGQDGAYIFDLDYRATHRLWVGAGGQWGDTNDTWAGMLRLGTFFPGDTADD